MPVSIETEQGLLGAILNDPAALDRVQGLVDSQDFAEQLHGLVFQAMVTARAAGDPININTVKLALGDRDLGGITVGGYVARLMRGAVTVIGAPGYARIVRRLAIRRRMIATGQDLILSAQVDAALSDPLPVAKAAIADLDVIVVAGSAKNQAVISLGDAAMEAIELAVEVRAGRKTVGRPYGLPTLDRNTVGLVPGELIVAGGRPGMGKTTFASVIALNVALAGSAVGMISMEMTGIPVAQRVLSNLAYDPSGEIIPYNAIARAIDLSDSAIEALIEARYKIAALPFWIEQERGLTLSQIGARARQMKARAEREGRSFDLLVVDHLGLIQPSSRYAGNRVQEISEMTRGLKILAGELDTCVLLLSQLSRDVESRDDKRPQKRDFRDSGSIEQDADVMFGLFREAYYLETKEDKTTDDLIKLDSVRNVLEVEILKQRQGPQDRYRFFCDIGCNVISELQYSRAPYRTRSAGAM